MGSRYGEFGGASELVEKAIQAVVAAWTLRGRPTELTPALIELVGARDVFDLVEGLTLGRYTIGPVAAPLIFQIAAAGDPVASETIAWAGRQLGSLAVGVIHQLALQGQEFEVVLVGGLFNGGAALIDPLRETIYAVAPRARLARLATLPVAGGVLLGMEQAGSVGPAPRQRLIETLTLLTDGKDQNDQTQRAQRMR
jgi:N-acetylglucosamine kinase-like BadF-type ATPase